ncbi:hypothetical protein [Hyphomicrobium sp.]|uniref:hypothetical protein n=1 Tax=Hyphomicrobium sp. TaxID=82 RepID=UPI002E33B8F2|nr:hypothetical protein [Hyphomicrobium sp.]HEX2842130.1 hypothetical protein [Hyphomicrobium sp.]
MGVFRLEAPYIRRSLGTPEFAMGVQVAKVVAGDRILVGYILGDIVFMSDEGDGDGGAKLDDVFKRQWQWPEIEVTDPFFSADESPEPREHLGFYQWWRELPVIGQMIELNGLTEIRRLVPNYNPWTQDYGVPISHLPYRTVTAPDDVFYRFEAWPVSKRVLQSSQRVIADTYAAPAREAPFVASGFGAVGRYALPKLGPHCYRWELQPISGTEIDIGACIPQNGQAGGGVEVRFRNDTDMRGPIANPIVFPVY